MLAFHMSHFRYIIFAFPMSHLTYIILAFRMSSHRYISLACHMSHFTFQTLRNLALKGQVQVTLGRFAQTTRGRGCGGSPPIGQVLDYDPQLRKIRLIRNLAPKVQVQIRLSRFIQITKKGMRGSPPIVQFRLCPPSSERERVCVCV